MGRSVRNVENVCENMEEMEREIGRNEDSERLDMKEIYEESFYHHRLGWFS